MMITGKIKNVVDFGAFVDLGIKETALVHISELSDHFVKDPMDAVKVGDVLEFRIIGLDRDRRRISLSRKSDPAEQKPPKQERTGEKKRVVVVKKTEKAGAGAPVTASCGENRQGGPGSGPRPVSGQPGGGKGAKGGFDDDGTMYNPFAEAFKKMKGKK
jgi:uncharacterized protein